MDENKEKSVQISELPEDRQAELKKAQAQLKELMDLEEAKRLIRDNTIEFTVKDVTYRIGKPTYKQKQDVYKKRCEKQGELLQAKNADGSFKYLGEAEVIKINKERGIDIDQMTRQIATWSIKEKELLKKLGEAIKEQKPDPLLEGYKEEIEQLRNNMSELISKKTVLLEYTIESQLLSFIYNYFTSLVTEKKVEVEGQEPKWVKAWNSFEEFEQSDEVLIGTANTYLTILISDQIE